MKGETNIVDSENNKTLYENLVYINEIKTTIKQSIINKGQSVSDNDAFMSYAEKIDNITTGGSDEYTSIINKILYN